jgi:hypothetical protein
MLGCGIVWKVGLNRDQVIGLQIRFEMNKSLDRGQSQRGGSVDHAHALTIPATAVEPGTLAGESAGRVDPTANPPEAHQL